MVDKEPLTRGNDLIRHSVLRNFPQNRMMLSFLMVCQSLDMTPRSTMRTNQLGGNTTNRKSDNKLSVH